MVQASSDREQKLTTSVVSGEAISPEEVLDLGI